MSFSAGSILGSLDLDTGGFTQGMLGAESLMGLFPGLVTSFMADPLLGLAHLVKDVFGSITGIMKEAFDASQANADKIHDMAINVGVSAEALSALGIVAAQAGASTEAVADAFKFLGKNVSNATQGNKEAIAGFSQIGVSFADAAGHARPLEAVMNDVADAIAKIPPGALRTDAALTLLGRGGSELIATFDQGSDAIREQIELANEWSATVSTKAAASADEFGDSLGTLGIIWKGLQNVFGEEIRDNLNPILHDLIDWLNAHRTEIMADVREIARVTVAAIDEIIVAAENLKGTLAGIAAGGTFGAVIGSALGPLGTIVGAGVGALGGGIVGANISASMNPQQVHLHTPAIDVRDASSEVAAKLVPVVRDGFARMQADAQRATTQALIESGF